MATYNEPAPRASINAIFRGQLESLAKYAAEQARAAAGGQPAEWYRPANMESSTQNIQALHTPFSREEQESQFVASVKDPNASGTVGDLFLVQVQGDFLHCLERAYRARHHSVCRGRAHAAGRLRGHGHEFGGIRQGLLRYVLALDYSNKSETA
jgi:hypothetical protein